MDEYIKYFKENKSVAVVLSLALITVVSAGWLFYGNNSYSPQNWSCLEWKSDTHPAVFPINARGEVEISQSINGTITNILCKDWCKINNTLVTMTSCIREGLNCRNENYDLQNISILGQFGRSYGLQDRIYTTKFISIRDLGILPIVNNQIRENILQSTFFCQNGTINEQMTTCGGFGNCTVITCQGNQTVCDSYRNVTQ